MSTTEQFLIVYVQLMLLSYTDWSARDFC